MKKSLIAVLLVSILSLTFTGCANNSSDTTPSSTPSETQTTNTTETTTNTSANDDDTASDYEPVTIQNGDRTITFTKMPEKVLCYNIYATENMLSLGLGDKIAATAEMTAGNVPLPENEEGYNALPKLGEKSHELALGFDPDFCIGQVSSFSDKAWGSTEMFEEKGINVYIISGTIIDNETIENIYEDLTNLGKIFKVEDKAQELIDDMKAKVDGVTAKVASVEEPVTVFVMDSNNGNEIYTTSFGLESSLIEMAGGVNVTKGEADSRWFNTTVETIIDKDPDFIIFNEYGTQSIEEKIAFINDNPALADVTAVKEQNYITIPLQYVMQDTRAASAVEIFAEAFYPELFS